MYWSSRGLGLSLEPSHHVHLSTLLGYMGVSGIDDSSSVFVYDIRES